MLLHIHTLLHIKSHTHTHTHLMRNSRTLLILLFFCGWTSVYSLDPCVSIIDISSCPTDSPCTTTCSSGLISRSNYGINENNEVIINIESGYMLTLRITILNTEADYDFITVISCDSIYSCVNVLGRYSGNSLPTTYPQSRTGIMKIAWNSDSSGSVGSWEASYSVDAKPAPPSTPACRENLYLDSTCTAAQPCTIQCSPGNIYATSTQLGKNVNVMHIIISNFHRFHKEEATHLVEC